MFHVNGTVLTMANSDLNNDMLLAGKDFPWEYIHGYYLLFKKLMSFSYVDGHMVKGPKLLNAYGVATVVLPNPDISENERILTLPIENSSDFKSLTYAQIDSGVTDGTNELGVLFENNKGLFGGRKPSFHVAIFPAGTWLNFFDSITNYKEYQWPAALCLYQPSKLPAFRSSRNIFAR